MLKIKKLFVIIIFLLLPIKSNSFELVRDVELEEFTREILITSNKNLKLSDDSN